ncbi:MAG: enoyl-CoA hydratase-related protein, partial [Acidimicrobiia bacterium]
MYEHITYEVDDPVATITLTRPESLNAWTNTMDVEVRDAIARAAADPAVVGIVVTGAGRAFCAGADMKLLQGLSSGGDTSGAAAGGATIPEGDHAGDFDGRFGYLMTTPKPIIAAINGATAGMAYPFA